VFEIAADEVAEL